MIRLATFLRTCCQFKLAHWLILAAMGFSVAANGQDLKNPPSNLVQEFVPKSAWSHPLGASTTWSNSSPQHLSGHQDPSEFKLTKAYLYEQLSAPITSIHQGAFTEAGSVLNPGTAFLSSALLPGAGQALQKNWGRAAIFAAVELAGWAYYLNRQQLAKDHEAAYEQYGNTYWSPLAYAHWLVDYSKANNLVNGYEVLEAEIAGKTPAFGSTTDDWSKVREQTVRDVEVRTRFIFNIPEGCGSLEPPACVTRSEFSHVLQDYGSQQYYELMSKYYQFQPGWQDFHEQRLAQGNTHVYQYSWDAAMLTERFMEGRDRAEAFNNEYREAGNVLKLLLVNHMIAAFDSYFSAKLKQSRIQTQTASVFSDRAVSIIWHF